MGKGMGPMGGMGGAGGFNPGFNPYAGFQGKGKGKGKFNKGKGKFDKGKGKGKKGKDGDAEGDEKGEGDADGKEDGDAPKWESRPVNPIVAAQREARQRFEKDILDRIQGRWTDEGDPQTTYVVEGSIVSVSSGDGGRGFRNRLSAYGVDMCWDARRFWHYLNLPEMYKAGDLPERIEWNPGKDSPPTEQIVWLKAPPLPEGEEEAEGKKDESAPAEGASADGAPAGEVPADGAPAEK